MNWGRIEGNWKQFWGRLIAAGRARSARNASREQLAQWLAHEHKRDPIHR